MFFGGVRGTLCLACVVLGGCATPKAPPEAPPPVAAPTASALARYLPLVDGTQWAYDVEEDETGNKGVFVTRARALGPGTFSLVNGQRSRVVEMRADGILRRETGVYLLRAPLQAGAEWPGEAGATVRVTAVDRIVEVPAGTFTGCCDTTEELRAPNADPVRRITTTYCPDVGIVSLYAEAWDGGRRTAERAVLRSFGKPISL